MDIQAELFKMQDEDYRKFNSSLLPTVSPEKVIGVRTPMLRAFARELAGTKEAEKFLKMLPHQYYEENNLHGFIVEKIKDFDAALFETERFLPYIDNWATCDTFFPKVFAKHPEKLLPKIKEWIKSEHTYTVRYAIGQLMRMYLDSEFNKSYPKMVSEIRSDDYYINMMIAWYFATALAKQYDSVIGYITEHRLSPWINNKAIQKAIESRRIPPETKEYIRRFKIKRAGEVSYDK